MSGREKRASYTVGTIRSAPKPPSDPSSLRVIFRVSTRVSVVKLAVSEACRSTWVESKDTSTVAHLGSGVYRTSMGFGLAYKGQVALLVLPLRSGAASLAADVILAISSRDMPARLPTLPALRRLPSLPSPEAAAVELIRLPAAPLLALPGSDGGATTGGGCDGDGDGGEGGEAGGGGDAGGAGGRVGGIGGEGESTTSTGSISPSRGAMVPPPCAPYSPP